MADHTKIEWCDATVNWWVGCTEVSSAGGCDHCYAKRIAAPFWGQKWGPGVPRRRFEGAAASLKALDRKAQRLGRKLSVFHNSVSDMFDNEVPDTWRMEAFQAMAETPNLTHLVLTKRIGNVRPYTQRDGLAFDLIGAGRVWLGITVCNQEEADRDIQKLMAVEALNRYLSIEPMLGPVDLWHVRDASGYFFHALSDQDLINFHGQWIKWVIVGGESGHGARPMHPDWVRRLRDQCQAAGTPFMFKQWGEFTGDPGIRAEARKWTMVDRDGRTLETAGSTANMGPITHVAKVGKHAAGRLLDSIEHNGRPE